MVFLVGVVRLFISHVWGLAMNLKSVAQNSACVLLTCSPPGLHHGANNKPEKVFKMTSFSSTGDTPMKNKKRETAPRVQEMPARTLERE